MLKLETHTIVTMQNQCSLKENELVYHYMYTNVNTYKKIILLDNTQMKILVLIDGRNNNVL